MKDRMPFNLLVDQFQFQMWMAHIREEAKKRISAADMASEESLDFLVVDIIHDVTDGWMEEFITHVKNTLIAEQEPLNLDNIKGEIDKLLGGM